MEDPVQDNLIGSNPCFRRTSPAAAKPKMYVLSTQQVWQLHDAMPERLRVAVLLGAFGGLRVSEACGLRASDINFWSSVIHPKQQYGGKPPKTAACDAPIPIPRDLLDMINASIARYPSEYVVASAKTGRCHPVDVQLAVATARDKVPGLPETVTYHDLRHHLACEVTNDAVSAAMKLRRASGLS